MQQKKAIKCMLALSVLEDAISQPYPAMPHDAGDEIQLPVHEQHSYIPDCAPENDYTYFCYRLGLSKNRTKTDNVEFQSESCSQKLVSCKKERKSTLLWSVTLYLYFDSFIL